MADKEIKPKGRWAKKRASKKKNLSKPSYRKTGRLRLQDMLKAGLVNASDQKIKPKLIQKIKSILKELLLRTKISFVILLTG